jgi:acetyl esterase/lipase
MKMRCCLVFLFAAPSLFAAEAPIDQQQAHDLLPREKSSGRPDFENQKYGPSASNVLDLWQAKANHPTPLVIYIHGGGLHRLQSRREWNS